MTNQLTKKDYELISAYIDNALHPKEQARIEARLKSDAALRRTLRELKDNRALLRKTPQLRTQRNFTLSPAMVGAPEHRWFPTFRLAFAVASMLFIFVFAGSQFNPLDQPAMMALPEAESAAQSVEEIAVQDNAVPEGAAKMPVLAAESEEAVQAAENAFAPSEDGTNGESQLAEEPAALAVEKASEEEAPMLMLAGAPEEEMGGGAEAPQVREMEEAPEAAMLSSEPALLEETLASEEPSNTDAPPQPQLLRTVDQEETPAPVPEPARVQNWLIILQWVFGLTALAAGVVTLILKIRTR